MAVEFKNKKILVDFEHAGEEIKLTGSARVDHTTKTVEHIAGDIYKVETVEGEDRIGEFDLRRLSIFSMENIKYRTTASTMLDEVLVQAQAQAESLIQK